MGGTSREGDETATAVLQTAVGSTSGGAPPATTPPGAPPQLGRYAVLEAAGSGGMGTVWRAYDPKLRREVALKRLRRDTLGSESHLRLVREAQAMAQLSHPHVVAVYDVEFDEADASDVLIAMEYVPGATLRGWLRDSPRSLSEILDVFGQAGRGLVAAHRAGLVHRDFKPSNVLVHRDADGHALAKVTDFGLAKAMAPGNTDALDSGAQQATGRSENTSRDSLDELGSPLTDADVVMGTPRYMAPEQHASVTAGPAADQYAFCVALWEALAGDPPFSGARMRAAKFKGPPAWPRDKPIPRRILAALRRGLCVDADARWPSMADLLEVLGDDPARRRRRWGALGVGGLVVVSAAGAGLMWQSHHAELCAGGTEQMSEVWDTAGPDRLHESFVATQLGFAADAAQRASGGIDRYAARWTHQHHEACEATTIRGEQSAEVMDLRMGCLQRGRLELEATLRVFTQPQPKTVERAVELVEALPDPVRCADIESLRRGVTPPGDGEQAQSVEQEQARLAEAAARRRAGQYSEGLELARRALGEAEAIGYDPLRVAAHDAVGNALRELGEYEEAETQLREALTLALRLGMHEKAAHVASNLLHLVAYQKARHAEGQWLGMVALGLAQDLDPGGGLEATVLGAMGATLHAMGDYDAAKEHLDRALAIELELYDENSLTIARTLNNLAANETSRGNYEESERLFREALRIRENALGSGHPGIGTTLTALGDLLRLRGELDEALEVTRRALTVTRTAVGTEHPYVADALNNIGIIEYMRGDYESAAEYNEQAGKIRAAVYGPDHPAVADSENNVGASLTQLARYEEAQLHHERALEIRKKAFAPDHPAIAMSLTNIGLAARHQGRYAQAENYARKALTINEKRLGPEHSEVANGHDNLGNALMALEAFTDGLHHYQKALEIRTKSLGPEHAQVARSQTNIGTALEELGRLDEAVQHQRRAIEIWERELGADYPDLGIAWHGLGIALQAKGKRDEARKAFERALQIRTEAFGNEHPDTENSRDRAQALR